jgi:hypothetical protein
MSRNLGNRGLVIMNAEVCENLRVMKTGHSSLCVLLLLAFLAVTPGQAGITSNRVMEAILRNTPAPQLVPAGMPLKTAEHLAQQREDACVLWGVGESMQPLYPPGTALIIERRDYEKLQKGMTVVYCNQDGRRVAHCVVGETRGGYLLQGINNSEEDAELLTEDNFVGVVVAAYAAVETDFRAKTLARLALKGHVLVQR